MTTSGTTTFNMDVSDLAEEAFERCGLELRSGYDAKSARRSLNLLLAELSNHQVNLWKTVSTTISMVQGTTSYTLDAAVNDVANVILTRDSVDTQMSRLSRDQYQNQPIKTTQGRPSQYWLHRLSTPVLYVYPAPENSTDTVKFYGMMRLEDVTAATETVDIPIRFLPAVTAGLTYYISLKRKPELAPNFKIIFGEELQRAQYEDRERVSFRAVPQVRR